MPSGFRRLNHYDVKGLIGAGGAGEVYRATDTRLGRDVALKILPRDVTGDQGRLARFQREARALAALNHPNIVTIYSVEECEGLHFITMELVDGRTLDAMIPGNGLGLTPFLSIALPLADSVASAHAAGLTHRDLKPQNVMIGRDGRLKVLDFGLARFTDPSSLITGGNELPTMVRTEEGMIVGTFPYLAPEQIDGRAADARSDVYALGVVFYEMATGRRPFVGDTVVALLAAIVCDEPVPAHTLAPALPPALHAIIHQCLAKEGRSRFADGAALCQALREVSLGAIPVDLVTSLTPRAYRPLGLSADTPSRTRRTVRPLVGRDSELPRLVEQLDAAAYGSGSLVLLSGEPGVGKTRLSEELVHEAGDRHMLTLTGHCNEGGTTPYEPFVEVIEQLLRALPDEALGDLLGPDAGVVGRLVPKVLRLAGGVAEPLPLEPDQQRRAIFTAIVDVVRRVARQQPVVLLLEDLHWADEATVGLLQQLTPQLADLPVLCLGTYRDIEADIEPPFEKGIATLLRQPRTLLLPIRCLTREAVAALLTSRAKSEPPAALVDAVFQDTEGNPFFVGELFQHLAEDGQLFDDGGSWKAGLTIDAFSVPEGVRRVIGRRFARLAEPTQRVLATAAIAGRQFELRLVEAMSGLDRDAFLEAIEEAERAQLITAVRSRRQAAYTFTHELIRSTLLADLSLPRRQRLHARAAKVMERLYGAAVLPDHAPEMARHLYEAGPEGDDVLAIHYLEVASDQAIANGALESGLDSITRALTLVQPNDARTHATLLWKRGLARRNVGQLMEAIADWEAALPLCDAAVDQVLVANLCQDLAHGFAWTGRGMLGVAAARRGLERLGPDHLSYRCRLTGSLGWNFALACDFESADPILRDALAMAEELANVQLVGEALLLTSWHYYLCMRRREQADACRRAAELLRPTGEVGKLCEALVNFQMACNQIGRPGDIAATEAEARTLAERLGRFDIRVHQLYSETQRDWLLAANLDALEAGFRRVEDVSGAWRWVAEGSLSQMYLWRGTSTRRPRSRAPRSRTSHRERPTPALAGAWGFFATAWPAAALPRSRCSSSTPANFRAPVASTRSARGRPSSRWWRASWRSASARMPPRCIRWW